MKPLIVLLITFAISLLALKLMGYVYDISFAARIAMSVMLLFTAIAHFKMVDGMAMMMPAFIPWKKSMVYLTGVIEIAAAIGLQIPTLMVLTGWLLIVFFIVILPANINAAMKGIDYQKGTNDGPGASYLWFRVPLQLLFILWTWFSVIGCTPFPFT